jgi:hypothetical protein
MRDNKVSHFQSITLPHNLSRSIDHFDNVCNALQWHTVWMNAQRYFDHSHGVAGADPTRVHVYSGHDTTLLPMLAGLFGSFDNVRSSNAM